MAGEVQEEETLVDMPGLPRWHSLLVDSHCGAYMGSSSRSFAQLPG